MQPISNRRCQLLVQVSDWSYQEEKMADKQQKRKGTEEYKLKHKLHDREMRKSLVNTLVTLKLL